MKNLVIVESPAKAKTIEKFLGADYTVKSSYGHIRDLAQKEMSINIENNYEPIYQVSDDKRKLVAELQKDVKNAEQVWLASDEDREGEAIAWHLQQELKLDPATTKRIVFNEITPTAIKHAIENPRGIDVNLVNAQQTRRVLDRLVGYEISPILWKRIKPELSAGRVQSVTVRLVVDREEEIRNFKSKTYFKVKARFDVGGGRCLVAEANKQYDTEQEASAMLQQIAKNAFAVGKVETKPAKQSPAPPFTTSTLQQEASRKLGFNVGHTMQVAQQLYEEGFITYMRTDSVNLSDLALGMAKKTVGDLYGQRYIHTRQYHTKSKGAQEAHEAIRPTHLENATIAGDPAQQRLYDLIWKRTIASQMADSELMQTTIEIEPKDGDMHFVAMGKQVVFDGFMKVYKETTDDEMELTIDQPLTSALLPQVAVGDGVSLAEANARQHYTQRPPRYTEASLVKKMEELGIGRPSTYAPTITVITHREYVQKEDRDPVKRDVVELTLENGSITRTESQENTGAEKGKLVPTDVGYIVTSFMNDYFTDIMDYNFTAKVEKDLDEVAMGHQVWTKVIDEFYKPFHQRVAYTLENSHKTTGERLLGTDPKSGKNVYAKIGRYGAMVQIGDTGDDAKPRFASMKKNQRIESITLDEALELFKLPYTVGQYNGEDVVVSVGRFGPYVSVHKEYLSLAKNDDPLSITLERCIEIIEAGKKKKAEKERLAAAMPRELGTEQDEPVVVNVGRFGPYLQYKKGNYHLPKGIDPLAITLEEAVAIIKSSSPKKKGKK